MNKRPSKWLLLIPFYLFLASLAPHQNRVGTGVPKNVPAPAAPAESEAEWKQACKDGSDFLCHRIGDKYEKTSRIEEARAIYEENCFKRNIFISCKSLGTLSLKEGKHENAIHAFKKACEGGEVSGCAGVGDALTYSGQFDAARKTYGDACSNGDSASCKRGTDLWEKLEFQGPKSVELSGRCQSGSILACNDLRERCEKNDDALACQTYAWTNRTTQSREYWTKACRLGNAYACLNAKSFTDDVSQIRSFFALGCDGGVGRGCHELAQLEAKAGNTSAAVISYDKGCKLGVQQDCGDLALLRQEPNATATWDRSYQAECNNLNRDACNTLGNRREQAGNRSLAVEAYHAGCMLSQVNSCLRLNQLGVKDPRTIAAKKLANARAQSGPLSEPPNEMEGLALQVQLLFEKFGRTAFLLLLGVSVVVWNRQKRTGSRDKGTPLQRMKAFGSKFRKEVYGSRNRTTLLMSYWLALCAISNLFCVYDKGHLFAWLPLNYPGGTWWVPLQTLEALTIGVALIQLAASASIFEKRRGGLKLYLFLVPLLAYLQRLYPPSFISSMHFWVMFQKTPVFASLMDSIYYGALLMLYPDLIQTKEPHVEISSEPDNTLAVAIGASDLETNIPRKRRNVQAELPESSLASLAPWDPSAYTGLELLGEGVSSKVYKAIEVATQSTIALKVLNPHLRTDRISLERFRREIQITRHLNHPQIVSVYDLLSSGEKTCLVMEHVPGLNLKDYIQLNAPIPIDHAVAFLEQILDILGACHSKNVIHRDLKPQNTIVMENRTLKLLDFGVARMTSLSDLTQTGTSLGSPEYMAPELFSSNTYDPRTDIYALGVMLFEILAGRLPYQGESVAVLFRQHAQDPTPNLRTIRSDVPVWLAQLVGRMLNKQPFSRYQCVEEILLDVKAKRVFATAIPWLDKRTCIACNQETLLSVEICTYCGAGFNELFKKGTFNVSVSTTADPDKLKTFLQCCFGDNASRRRLAGGDLLLSRVPSESAQALKSAAVRYGVYLGIESVSEAKGYRQFLDGMGLLGSHAAILAFLVLQRANLKVLIQGYVPEKQIILLVSGILLSWYFSKRYLRSYQSALLSQKDSLSLGQLSSLKALAPRLKQSKSPAMREFVAQVIERSSLLLSRSQTLPMEVRVRVEELMTVSADAAVSLSEMEKRLNDPKVFQWGQTFAELENRLEEEADPEKKLLIVSQQGALKERLEEHFEIENEYALLMRNLSNLNFSLTSLLVQHLSVGTSQFQIKQFEQSIRSLRETVQVSQEICQELRKIA